MKNLLRRFHIGSSQDDHSDPSGPKSRSRFSSSDATSTTSLSESKPLSGLSGWLNVAKHTLNQAGNNLKHKKEDVSDSRVEEKDEIDSRAEEQEEHCMAMDVAAPTASSPVVTAERRSSDSAIVAADVAVKDAKGIALERAQTAALQHASDQALFLQDEELQVRVAMALSVRDDPEAAAIETAKDLSLGSDPSLSNSTAEVLAYRYWKYNALNYDDKVVDGFYDVYGVLVDLSSSGNMPALIDLQETPVSDQMTWEVVLVNRATDNDLVNLEQKAMSIALSSRAVMAGDEPKTSGLIYRIAGMVADQMGGPVVDADFLLKRWRTNSNELRLSLGNIVLPLGRLQIGLGRHRALLFKVLADAVGIPCQLVKGRQYTGSDEGAVNIIKVDAGREFIIDLMGAPGTLIPSDVSGISLAGLNANVVQEDFVPSILQTSDDAKNGFVAGRQAYRIASSGKEGILADLALSPAGRHQSEPTELTEVHAIPARPTVSRSAAHWRSPSWTEGIGLPAVRDMKVKDVSQYMMDAAKENPTLAQKLHDVLLESGLQAPPDLFSEISPKQLHAQISEDWRLLDESQRDKAAKGNAVRRKEKNSVGPGRPPAPAPSCSSSSEEGGKDRLQRLNSVEGLGERRPLDPSYLSLSPSSSPSSSASSGAASVQSSNPVLPASAAMSLVQENLPPELIRHVPVAAAAAATAAVVASSMVVKAAKSDQISDPTLEVPVAAAATATAAVVVATSAVVGRRLELPFSEAIKEDGSKKGGHEDIIGRHEEADAHVKSPTDSGPEGQGSGGADKYPEEERVSDKSSGSISAKSDRVLEDVAEWEIPWEELVIGERIGLGSYGEVYHGDWHGTEVAVKKFIDQDISGDALEEFRSEVRLMKRMRHPNVVLFMGAVMRAPNLSIVTEFLPRGSLYRLIHRSNSQLDERRRMRMALDVARGMNYLHNSTPVIVHRDLKSPNLLVDKNWVVKVCDFGLSRMKHNTFLSSKSTAGTPEWMAPEVLRNEPSNEKSDVYSFGVILWELATLQQPWAGMNSMQVVGAVGFQHRILDVPEDLDPVIIKIIRQCWQSDPAARPSFAEIMAALKPLQKPLTPSQTLKS